MPIGIPLLCATCNVLSGTHRLNLCHVLVALGVALAASGLSSAKATDDLPQVTPELRQQAVGIVRDVLEHEHLWVKVHAAEYLLWLDCPGGVKETFTKELELHSDEPQYRIGIWRVLGRAAPNEHEQEKRE